MRRTTASTGERLMCTSKTFMKMEIRTCRSSPRSSSGGTSTSSMADTRPSAGAMTRPSRTGVTRGGSRKK